MPPRWLSSSVLLLGLACAGCASPGSSFGWFSGRRIDTPSEVPGAISRARMHLAGGRTADALDLLRQALKVKGVASEVRLELEQEVERAAEKRIQELSQPGSSPAELARMLDLGLPAPLAVSASVQAARMYLERGRNYKCYTTLKKTETKYPLHHESRAAGALLAEAGLRMASDPWSFLGLFRTRDDGVEALEYLVVTYPSEPRCAEAYFELARIYAHDEEWDLAIERHSELIKWHRRSPLSLESEALIPRARLAKIESPEYDRAELLQARAELDVWLERHGSSLPPAQEGGGARPEVEEPKVAEVGALVRRDLADCLQRLTESDLAVARFYRRIDEPGGARRHAERALSTAREAGSGTLVTRCEALLRSLPAPAEASLPETRETETKLPPAPAPEPAPAPVEDPEKP